MFNKYKTHYAVSAMFFLQLIVLGACGPVGGNDGPTLVPHNEMLLNYENNAVACYNPVITGDTINCDYTARYAHHTMTFLDVSKAPQGNYKTFTKVGFSGKDELSCLNYAAVTTEKIMIYPSNNNDAQVSDLDVELKDMALYDKLKAQKIAQLKPRGEVCYKYILTVTKDPKMTYQFSQEEYIGGKPTGKTEKFAIFSNGSNIQINKK